MPHSALLIAGSALLTCVLAALVFRENSGDERAREERKLLAALDGQRRIRDAQRLREERARRSAVSAPHEPQVDPQPDDDDDAAPAETAVAGLPAADDQRARSEKAERRAAEEQRKREEKEQAATLEA